MIPSLRKRGAAPATVRPHANRRRLLVESLEERRLLAIVDTAIAPNINLIGEGDILSIAASFIADEDAETVGDESVTAQWSLYLDDGFDLILGFEPGNQSLDLFVFDGQIDTVLDTSADSRFDISEPITFVDNEPTALNTFELSYDDIVSFLPSANPGDTISGLAVLTFNPGVDDIRQTAWFTITIAPEGGENQSPVIDDAGIVGPGTAVAGQSVTYTVGVTDADSTAAQLTHTWTVLDNNTGLPVDGLVLDVASSEGVSQVTFAAPYNGSFSVAYSVMDETNLQDSTIPVELVVGNISLVDGVLSVLAQPGGSTVVISNGGSGTSVNYDGTAQSFAGVGSIVVYGQDGSDVIVVAASVTTPVTILAGGGNDIITGGSGADILVGGDGSDIIISGAGRDLIIGGDGADILLGNGGDDILIAGYTMFDGDAAAIAVLLAIWNGAGTPAERISDLETAGLNSTNVFDDDATDLLAGNAGFDWFFANLTLDGAGDRRDLILDRTSAENLARVELVNE